MTDDVTTPEQVLMTKLPIKVSQNIVDILKEKHALKVKFNEDKKALHEKLWEQVHSEYPDLDQEVNYSLNSEFIDGDIVILQEEKEDDDSGLPESLKRILAKVLTK